MRRRQGPQADRTRRFLLVAAGVLLAAGAVTGETLHHRRYLQTQSVEVDADDVDRSTPGPPTGGLDDLGSSEQRSRAGLVAGYLRDRFMLSNASNAPQNNQEPFYPGCGIFDAINREGRGCNFIRVQKAFLVRYWIDFESLTLAPVSVMNPNGELPHMLAADLRPNPPKQVPQDIIRQELPTYYYCYKAILRLYQVTFGYLDSRPMSWPFLDGGWENQKLHFVHSASRGDTPMAASLTRGERMLVVIRGTMWLEEWDTDFQYQWADQGSEPLLPGKVHTGMMSVFDMFYKSVVEEVKALKPREILVTGHSLGAGLAIYMAHVLQNRLAADWPLSKVEVVGFGGPNPGDREFVDSYSRSVNARHVLFVGEGAGDPAAEGRQYVLGDVVAQYTCGPYPGCDSIGTGPNTATYDYARPRSQVPFAAGDMNNAKRWHSLTNLYHGETRIPSFRRIIAAHVCSYLCWTATAVGDPADHCYFRDDQRGDIPEDYLCDTSSVSLP